jgi:hypothetical protein
MHLEAPHQIVVGQKAGSRGDGSRIGRTVAGLLKKNFVLASTVNGTAAPDSFDTVITSLVGSTCRTWPSGLSRRYQTALLAQMRTATSEPFS